MSQKLRGLGLTSLFSFPCIHLSIKPSHCVTCIRRYFWTSYKHFKRTYSSSRNLRPIWVQLNMNNLGFQLHRTSNLRPGVSCFLRQVKNSLELHTSYTMSCMHVFHLQYGVMKGACLRKAFIMGFELVCIRTLRLCCNYHDTIILSPCGKRFFEMNPNINNIRSRGRVWTLSLSKSSKCHGEQTATTQVESKQICDHN